jgi:hypothetical protein
MIDNNKFLTKRIAIDKEDNEFMVDIRDKSTYFIDDLKEIQTNYKIDNKFSISEEDIEKDRNWFPIYCKFIKEITKDNIERINNIINDTLFQNSVKSYERFLYLTAKCALFENKNIEHPTYAIDLVWHGKLIIIFLKKKHI